MSVTGDSLKVQLISDPALKPAPSEQKQFKTWQDEDVMTVTICFRLQVNKNI